MNGGKRGNMSRGANCSAWDMVKLVEGSVKALVEYGFDSVKLDSGFSVGRNLSLWAEVLNKSGRPVMIENCHQGDIAPGENSSYAGANNHNCTGLGRADGNTGYSDCPFTFWRTTGDPYPDWGTIMRELNGLRKVKNRAYGVGTRKSSVPYNIDPPRSRPGGWACEWRHSCLLPHCCAACLQSAPMHAATPEGVHLPVLSPAMLPPRAPAI